jgi:hypothetical protein
LGSAFFALQVTITADMPASVKQKRLIHAGHTKDHEWPQSKLLITAIHVELRMVLKVSRCTVDMLSKKTFLYFRILRVIEKKYSQSQKGRGGFVYIGVPV